MHLHTANGCIDICCVWSEVLRWCGIQLGELLEMVYLGALLSMVTLYLQQRLRIAVMDCNSLLFRNCLSVWVR